jgi:energy-coupling factor transporter ATP-binding protein EcfA2
MENRLDFFRQQMAAFDGSADPSGAFKQGFYIEEPNQSATNQWFKRICLKPTSRNLVVGGIGSGKTTQLLRMKQLLEQTDVYPHYVDVSQYEHPDEIQEGFLNAIFGLELIKLMAVTSHSTDVTTQRLIKEYAYGSADIRDLPLSNKSYSESSGEYGGVLSPHSYRRLSNKINLALQHLASEFNQYYSKKPFFLLDGLDRVDNIEKFVRSISSVFDGMGIGYLIIGPIGILYSNFIDSIDSYFDYFEYRPAFDVTNDIQSRNFFSQILNSRSTGNFLDEQASAQLINMSGGILRDLINLTQESIQEAYLSDADGVGIQHVDRAVVSLGRSKMLGLYDDDQSILSRLKDESKSLFIPTSPREIALLASGRILEYRYPKRRFSTHPVLSRLLASQIPA